MKRTSTSALLAGLALATTTSISQAVFTTVTSQDTPHCDPLMPLSLVDELGNPSVFPSNEIIDSNAALTQLIACPSHDDPTQPNVLVTIRNMTTISFVDLHYVADPNIPGVPGTSISNEDGIVNSGQAFRIDKLGVNTPLVAESMTANHIFEPGEFWQFIIDDYVNTGGLSPAAFTSIGVGIASVGPPSSGSIIAIPIPEPGTLTCVGLAGAGALVRRRRHA